MTISLSLLAGSGWQFFDNSGDVLTGGLLYSYAAGTTTPATTYTSVTGLTANSNPIVLDAAGRVPNQIWLTDGIGYKFRLENSVGTQIGTWDNITSQNTGSTGLSASAISYTAAGSSTVRTVQAKLSESVSVKDFGAVGNGVTNDTLAIQAACNFINAAGGGTLVVPAGTYLVGLQTLTGVMGAGASWLFTPMFSFANCTKPVVLKMEGAVIKLADGMRIGSFDPVTGAVYATTPPFTDVNYRAQAGNIIDVTDCVSFSLVGSCELDGNNDQMILGGQWGDINYQVLAHGIKVFDTLQTYIENVYTHHCGTDGVYSGWSAITSRDDYTPVTLVNVRSEYNGRQGLSWVGGIGLTATNCKFNFTGRAGVSSAPRAGVDIEPNAGGVCRYGQFINCEFIDNVGVGTLLDTGDSEQVSFHRCKIVGTTARSIWPQKPFVSYRDCTIVGSAVNVYGSTTDPEAATKFFNCYFTDEVSYCPVGKTAYVPSNLLVDFATVANNVLLENCTILATTARNGNIQNAILRNCTIVCKAGTEVAGMTDLQWVIVLWGSVVDNILILDEIVNVPATGYYVNLQNTERFLGRNNLVSPASKIKWANPTSGFTGYYGQTNPEEFSAPAMVFHKTNSRSAATGLVRMQMGTAAPASGTYAQGDRVFNQNATVGQPKSWVCTVAGTPGTWVSEGNL